MIETYDKPNSQLKIKKIQALPKNVKQIGDANNEHRIYMEDYAYTYLHQYAAKEKSQEQIAFLVGQVYQYKKEVVLIISGAVQAKFLKEENGNLFITDDTWIYAREKADQYFKNCSIVGWMCTQPGYGILLTSFLSQQHQKQFQNQYQVLYVIDPVEKEHAFFISKDNELHEKTGFYIFYDKNTLMHDYMMDYKIVNTDGKENNQQDVVRAYRRIEHGRKEEHYQKKLIHMLSLISGALVIICIIIGIGLLNNMEKMKKMQTTMHVITEDHDKLKQQVSDVNISPTKAKEDENSLSEETKPKVSDGDDNNTDTPQGDEAQDSAKMIGSIPKTYVIESGDNLNAISIRFYHTKGMVPKIQELNDISNPDRIYIGQKLILPEAE